MDKDEGNMGRRKTEAEEEWREKEEELKDRDEEDGSWIGRGGKGGIRMAYIDRVCAS